MKPGVIALAVGVAAVGGYVYYSNMEATKAAVDQEAAMAAEVVEDAAETAVEAASDAVDNVSEAASEAVEAAGEVASEAADVATEVATDVETGVEEAVDAVTDTITEVTESGAEVADQADAAATDAATDAASDAVSEAAEATENVAATAMEAAAGLLTADGFDLDNVVDLISGSSLDETKKLALTTAVTQAKDNPELLNAVLGQVKSALGL